MQALNKTAVILLATTVLFAACGGDDDGSPPDDLDVLTSVEVTPSTSALNSVAPGNSVQLSAVAKNQDGGTMSGGTPSFSTQDPAVATVSSTGLVTAAGAGTTQVVASMTAAGATKQGSATVTVAAPPAPVLTSVTVNPGTTSIFSLAPGNTVQLLAAGKDQNGAALNNVTFDYSSQGETVATVSSGGLVTAAGTGTVQITVSGTRDGVTKEASSTVTVQVAPASATVTAPQGTYLPSVVHISAGGSVTWSFGSVPHDVDFTSAGAPTDIPVFESGSESRTFPTSGAYQYLCNLHAGMQGSVTVH